MKNKINVQDIDVAIINFSTKDTERAQGLQWQGSTFFGNGAPFKGETEKMAKAIKCPIKLVRRAKAVINLYGRGECIGLSNGGAKEHPCNPYQIFTRAMYNMGFSCHQVSNL